MKIEIKKFIYFDWKGPFLMNFSTEINVNSHGGIDIKESNENPIILHNSSSETKLIFKLKRK